MTQNQIQYAKLREETRHNVVSEGQAGVANVIAERNAETNRMNALTNQYSANLRAAELTETARANRANELLISERNAETARYQQENNRIAHENVYQQKLNRESNERIAAMQAGTSQRNTDVNTRASIVETLIGVGKVLIRR